MMHDVIVSIFRGVGLIVQHYKWAVDAEKYRGGGRARKTVRTPPSNIVELRERICLKKRRGLKKIRGIIKRGVGGGSTPC